MNRIADGIAVFFRPIARYQFSEKSCDEELHTDNNSQNTEVEDRPARDAHLTENRFGDGEIK